MQWYWNISVCFKLWKISRQRETTSRLYTCTYMQIRHVKAYLHIWIFIMGALLREISNLQYYYFTTQQNNKFPLFPKLQNAQDCFQFSAICTWCTQEAPCRDSCRSSSLLDARSGCAWGTANSLRVAHRSVSLLNGMEAGTFKGDVGILVLHVIQQFIFILPILSLFWKKKKQGGFPSDTHDGIPKRTALTLHLKKLNIAIFIWIHRELGLVLAALVRRLATRVPSNRVGILI